jgi:uncharacterized protein (DUF58 family)
VLTRIKEVWRADRKPANVMMVFDNSESMGHENKLAQALKGLKGFFREAAPQDHVGLIKFSSEITELVPIGPMRTNRAKLLAAADRIVPERDHRHGLTPQHPPRRRPHQPAHRPGRGRAARPFDQAPPPLAPPQGHRPAACSGPARHHHAQLTCAVAQPRCGATISASAAT